MCAVVIFDTPKQRQKQKGAFCGKHLIVEIAHIQLNMEVKKYD